MRGGGYIEERRYWPKSVSLKRAKDTGFVQHNRIRHLCIYLTRSIRLVPKIILMQEICVNYMYAQVEFFTSAHDR